MNETDHISFSFSKLLKKYDIIFFNENFRDIENKINKNKNKSLNNKFYKSYININYKIIKYLKNSSLKKNQIIKLINTQALKFLMIQNGDYYQLLMYQLVKSYGNIQLNSHY